MDSSIEKLRAHIRPEEWPDFLAIKTEGNSYIIDVFIRKNIKWFEGHFPEQPVLAGVVQTHWAGELSKYLFAIDQDFMQLINLKFQSVILPNINIHISLEHQVETNSVKFRFYDTEQTYSEGKFVFAMN